MPSSQVKTKIKDKLFTLSVGNKKRHNRVVMSCFMAPPRRILANARAYAIFYCLVRTLTSWLFGFDLGSKITNTRRICRNSASGDLSAIMPFALLTHCELPLRGRSMWLESIIKKDITVWLCLVLWHPQGESNS